MCKRYRSLLDEVERIAAAKGTTFDQFINVAVAEKAPVLPTEAYFWERAERAEFDTFDRILEKAGTEPPGPGDEVPE